MIVTRSLPLAKVGLCKYATLDQPTSADPGVGRKRKCPFGRRAARLCSKCGPAQSCGLEGFVRTSHVFCQPGAHYYGGIERHRLRTGPMPGGGSTHGGPAVPEPI